VKVKCVVPHMRIFVSSLLLFFIITGCQPTSESNNTQSIKKGLSGLTHNFDPSLESWRGLLDGADEAGVTFLHHQMPPWSEAESSEGMFEFPYFSELFKDERKAGYEYSLDIATPLGLGKIDVPNNFSFTSFKDPNLLQRYLAYVDAALKVFPNAQYVILHTETVENFFAESDPSNNLADFCDFIAQTIQFIHESNPSVQVGIYGTKNESSETLSCLNRETDFFGIGYIADRGDDDHKAILRRLLNASESKPIFLYEVGIPTSPFLGGSEQQQVEFIGDLSSLIAEFGQRIIAVSYYQHQDESAEVVAQYVPQLFPEYTNTQQKELIEFFSSLGLKRSDGSRKPGWQRFLELISVYRA
jgi:hypothetical protein